MAWHKDPAGRIALCLVATVLGAVVLLRGLARFSPPRPVARPPSVVPDQASVPSKSGHEQTPNLSAQFECERTMAPGDLDAVAAEIRERVSGLSETTPIGSRAAALAAETSAYVRTVLSASLEDFLDYGRQRGAVHQVDFNDPAAVHKYRQYHEATAPAYRWGPVSVRGLMVRPRVVGGREIPASDFGASVRSHYAPKRFPQLAALVQETKDGIRITGETYEVVCPVTHSYDGAMTTVLIGIWLTWSPEAKQWYPSRLNVYAPRALDTVVAPAF